jgi:hypothetical protein
LKYAPRFVDAKVKLLKLAVGSQQRFTTKYLTSWEQWWASGGATTVSSLRETTYANAVCVLEDWSRVAYTSGSHDEPEVKVGRT